MEKRGLEIQPYTISVQNSPSIRQQHHTFQHVWQKIISGCAGRKYEAKRRYCTYHHPHKKSAIFYFTYLECKIKQIKGTLHNLAFIFYQIAHNCNHKMIIFYHMCIRKADKGTGQPLHKKNGPVAPPSDLAGYYRSPNWTGTERLSNFEVNFVTERDLTLWNMKIRRPILLLPFFLKLCSPPSTRAATALHKIPITASTCSFSCRPVWELKNLSQLPPLLFIQSHLSYQYHLILKQTCSLL